MPEESLGLEHRFGGLCSFFWHKKEGSLEESLKVYITICYQVVYQNGTENRVVISRKLYNDLSYCNVSIGGLCAILDGILYNSII